MNIREYVTNMNEKLSLQKSVVNCDDLYIESNDSEVILGIGELYKDTLIFEHIMFNDILEIATEGVGEKIADIKNKCVTTLKKIWKRVKDWLKKVINNLKIMITPGSKLLTKYKTQLITAYKLYGDKITVSSPKYSLDSFLYGVYTILVLQAVSKLGEYLGKCIDGDCEFDAEECEFKIGSELIIDKDGKIDTDVVNQYAIGCIIEETDMKQRKLSEAIDIETFTEALDGKKKYKEMKDSEKKTDESFKQMIDVFNPDRKDNEGDDPEILRQGVKFTTAYTKSAMMVMNKFLPEYKKLYRFVISASKKLLKYSGGNIEEDKTKADKTREHLKKADQMNQETQFNQFMNDASRMMHHDV